jgi:hypothetical protein
MTVTLIFYDGKLEPDRGVRRDLLLEIYRSTVGKTTHKYKERPNLNWQKSRVENYVV